MNRNNDNEYTRMVVVAHADDAEFGCSGTVAKLCAEGWDMVYVLCTDGSKGTSDREFDPAELARVRQQEQVNAGEVLGLKDVVFLGYEDSMLQPTLELRRDIAREIRRHKPDVVICQYPMRTLDGYWGVGHPDHMAAGEATLAAIFPTARDHLTFPELLEDGLRAAQGGRGVDQRPPRAGPVDRRDRPHGHVHRGHCRPPVADRRDPRWHRGAHGREIAPMAAKAGRGQGDAVRRDVQADFVPAVGAQCKSNDPL